LRRATSAHGQQRLKVPPYQRELAVEEPELREIDAPRDEAEEEGLVPPCAGEEVHKAGEFEDEPDVAEDVADAVILSLWRICGGVLGLDLGHRMVWVVDLGLVGTRGGGLALGLRLAGSGRWLCWCGLYVR
jgi:hypothetical protein